MSSIKRLGVFAALCSLTLAGCASQKPVAGERSFAPTPLDKYKMTTKVEPDQLGLSIHPEGLSHAQQEALAAFAQRWHDAGGGTITLQIPADAPDPKLAAAYAQQAVGVLGSLGVPANNVRTVGFNEGQVDKPLILASFDRMQVEAPDCSGIKWENLSATNFNETYRRFGCVITANMALQIADPRDLHGTPEAPADNTRRMVVLGKYRDGKTTSSDKDTQANGAVSNSVQSQ